MMKHFPKVLPNRPTVAALAFLTFLAPLHAEVIVSTDFTGRTVSGKTASNIAYTLSGIVDPGDLTYTGTQSLFDTTDAQGHFAPAVNTAEETWGISIPLVFDAGISEIQIATGDVFSIDYQNFNSSGNYQGTSRTTSWVASIVGSVSGTVLTDSAASTGATSGTLGFFSTGSATLSDAETWTLVLSTDSPSGSGNRTGLSGFSLSGTPVESSNDPAVWYVNASRTGQATQDGTSWASAFASLQDALASASAGDEVWVAAGIYYPDDSEAGLATLPSEARFSSFNLIADVGIYGGFTGSETLRSERDPSRNITILSADVDHETDPDTTVGGIVVSDPENNILGANSFEIVSGVASKDYPTAILDGFTLTGAAGGASYNGGYFRRCVFQGNKGGPGAVYHQDERVIYVQCDFISNSGEDTGAVNAQGTDIDLISCRFLGNTCSGTDEWNSTIAIGSSTATMTNCLVAGNLNNGGSAVHAPDIDGAATDLRIENSTITGNLKTGSATSAGVSVASGAAAIIDNSIIWGNSGGSDDNFTGTATFRNSVTEGQAPGGDNLDGTLSSNAPHFLDAIAASSSPTTSGDYRIAGNSPTVEAGDAIENPGDPGDLDEDGNTGEILPFDLLGNHREIGDTDMGAYEYTGPTVTGSLATNYDVDSSTGFPTVLDLAEIFGQSGLTYQASSSAASVATASTSGDSLIVTPVGNPSETTTISVTATDAEGNRTTITFTVTLTGEIPTDPAYSLTQNLASWHTSDSARYARIYPTYAAEQAGTAVTTWDNGTYAQTVPAYAGVQEINHDDDYVYIRTTGLSAGHVMGPWYNDNGIGGSLVPFSNWPEAIHTTYQIPVQPVIPETKTTYGAGAIGLMIDGTMIFSESDTFSWDNDEDGSGNGSDTEPGPGSGGNGDGLWLHDAYLTEGNTFDKSNAHSAGNQLHYHASPMKLRHLLGDSVEAVQQPDGSSIYQENFNGSHSPILGWLNDGIPLYGPYGYNDAMDPESGVRRMVSGFIVRDGQNGSYDTAANGRTVIPAWSARYRGRSTACTINEQGPTAAILDVPYFMEDYDYLGDLTNPADGQPYEQNVDFDLNEYNCRFCVTPEFPEGTWAYFVSIGADGKPAFPYNVGAQYYGDPSDGGGITELPAEVSQTFLGGPDIVESNRSTRMENGDIVITWNVAEGGSYNIRTSETLAAWDDAPSDTVAVDNTLTVADTITSGVPAKFYQIARTGLAEYDDGAVTGGGGGGGNTIEGIQSVTPNSGNGSQTVTIVFNPAAMVPPAAVAPDSVTIGTVTGTSVSRNSTSGDITASFDLTSLADGAYTVTVNFTTPDGALAVTGSNLFTVTSGGGGGGGGIVSFAFTFATTPPLPQQGEITSAKVGTADATITSYDPGTGAVSMQFDNSTLATGSHSATFTFVPTAGPQAGNTVTRTSTNQYTKP